MAIEELAKQTEVVIGALFAIITLLGFVARWFWTRVKGTVNEGVKGVTSGQDAIVKRVNDLEIIVGRVDDDVNRVSGRVATIEQKLTTLAKTTDLNALAITLAEVRVTGRATAGQVDTLYRSVMERAERGK